MRGVSAADLPRQLGKKGHSIHGTIIRELFTSKKYFHSGQKTFMMGSNGYACSLSVKFEVQKLYAFNSQREKI